MLYPNIVKKHKSTNTFLFSESYHKYLPGDSVQYSVFYKANKLEEKLLLIFKHIILNLDKIINEEA
jgi:hypothetical protein